MKNKVHISLFYLLALSLILHSTIVHAQEETAENVDTYVVTDEATVDSNATSSPEILSTNNNNSLPFNLTFPENPPLLKTVPDFPEEAFRKEDSEEVYNFSPLQKNDAIDRGAEIAAGIWSASEETDTTLSEEELADYLPPLQKLPDPIYQSEFIAPWEEGDQEELLDFEFEDAELLNLIKYIEDRFGIRFIFDESLKPLPKNGRAITGAKISFKSHHPLTKREAWGLFLSFLDIAGLAPQPGPDKKTYYIASTDPKSPRPVTRGPLPLFIGIDPSLIPNNDTYITYTYFVQNANMDVIKNVMDSMKSPNSPALIPFPELRALMITDKAYNIKTMLEVINELDKVVMPETLSIIQLKHRDATQVAELYNTITKDGTKDQTLAARLLGPRKEQTASYFPMGARVIAEPHRNMLLLLGSEDAVKKIENFILNNIDKESQRPYTPTFVHQLYHTDAEAVASVVERAVKFQSDTEAAKAGGVRGGDKYFKSVSIIPEKSGNRLVIVAEYDEYLKLRDIIDTIDVEQPQVAIKVLIFTTDILDTKGFGSQIRNKKTDSQGLLGDRVNLQTSGLGLRTSIVENTANGSTGATKLLGDLVKVATGASVGSTVVSLGSDAYNVFAMFEMLDKYSHTNIISSPFVVTTNNYPVTFYSGETRRVETSRVIDATGQARSTFGNLDAKLELTFVPQISFEGFITLNISIKDSQFTEANVDSGNRTEKEINTSVILANNETIALGGLIQEKNEDNEIGNPLSKIPLIGWLTGKNKKKLKTKSSLIILITPEIIPSNNNAIAGRFTKHKLDEAERLIEESASTAQRRDPLHRWFFDDNHNTASRSLQEYRARQDRYIDPSLKENGKKRRYYGRMKKSRTRSSVV